MISSTLCYIKRGGCWLMLHRVKKKNDVNHDLYIGVGGHLEENESPYEGIRREIFEETALEIENLKYRGIITFVSDRYEGEYMHLFTADSENGEAKVCDEGDLEWININDVDSLPIWEGDRLFLDMIKRDTPFFEMKLVYEGSKLKEVYLDGQKKTV